MLKRLIVLQKPGRYLELAKTREIGLFLLSCCELDGLIMSVWWSLRTRWLRTDTAPFGVFVVTWISFISEPWEVLKPCLNKEMQAWKLCLRMPWVMWWSSRALARGIHCDLIKGMCTLFFHSNATR